MSQKSCCLYQRQFLISLRSAMPLTCSTALTSHSPTALMCDTTHLLGMKWLTFNLLIWSSINLNDKLLANVLPSKEIISTFRIFFVLKLPNISWSVLKSKGKCELSLMSLQLFPSPMFYGLLVRNPGCFWSAELNVFCSKHWYCQIASLHICWWQWNHLVVIFPSVVKWSNFNPSRCQWGGIISTEMPEISMRSLLQQSSEGPPVCSCSHICTSSHWNVWCLWVMGPILIAYFVWLLDRFSGECRGFLCSNQLLHVFCLPLTFRVKKILAPQWSIS